MTITLRGMSDRLLLVCVVCCLVFCTGEDVVVGLPMLFSLNDESLRWSHMFVLKNVDVSNMQVEKFGKPQ